MEVKINQGALFFAIFVFLCCIAFFVGVYDMIHVHREETLIEKIVIDENSWVKTVRYDVKPRPFTGVIAQYLICFIISLILVVASYCWIASEF